MERTGNPTPPLPLLDLKSTFMAYLTSLKRAVMEGSKAGLEEVNLSNKYTE